ncbi:MAG TPA: cysteine synthase A [Campylobacterales bacterium]|nr:cysteine synthase A [Campylobacterales bacterium]
MPKIVDSIQELIGNTPLIRLQRFGGVLAKCEFLNPIGSIKDRIALNILKKGIERGEIDSNTLIIEATSGNTGIALASLGASLGLKIVIVMPESMSLERRVLIQHFGAELVLTPANLGMAGAVEKAKELAKENPNSFLTSQFSNPDNPESHIQTAQEIWEQTDGKVDIFVAGVGTGGTISGVGRYLKKRNPNIRIVGVEPSNSNILSGGSAGSHEIQGIGAGFIPENLDRDILDEVVAVSDEDAIRTAKELAKQEGLLVGISSGANLFASKIVADRDRTKTVVTTLNDTGERYISTPLFQKENR